MNGIYVSTACLRGGEDAAAVVAQYRQAGLGDIELGSTHRFRPGLLDDLAGNGGCRFIAHNYFPPPAEDFVLNLGAADPAVLARSRAFVHDNLPLLQRLGVALYTVHAPYAVAAPNLGGVFPPDGAQDRAATLAIFRESLRELLPAAARHGITMLVENHVVASCNLVAGENRLLPLAEAEEIVEFLAAPGLRGCGLLLDLGHLTVTARTLGFAPAAFMRRVAPLTRVVHLSENDGTRDEHRLPTAASVALLQAAGLLDRLLVIEGTGTIAEITAAVRLLREAAGGMN